MILLPEIETVVILVPRTGSGALKRALLATYPRAVNLYRHMEADGVPAGYDRWRKIGVVRHPVTRLWSLWKFLQAFGGEHDPTSGRYRDEYVAQQRASAALPFERWIVENEIVFTHPYLTGGMGFHPYFTVRHPLPETRKSQFLYLRPDLGTRILHYGDPSALKDVLGVEPGEHNGTAPTPAPELTGAAADHIERFFSWDLASVDTHPKGGDATQIAAPFMSGAVASAQPTTDAQPLDPKGQQP